MSIYEQILNSNIINFLIVAGTLVLIFKKAHLGDLIEKAAQDVKSRVEKSAMSAQEAISEYKTIRKQTKDTPLLQEEILNSARENASNLEDNISKKTAQTIDEIRKSLEKIYCAQEEKEKTTLLNDVYSACVDLAQDEVKNQLSADIQKKLIDSSIDELDKIEGGLN